MGLALRLAVLQYMNVKQNNSVNSVNSVNKVNRTTSTTLKGLEKLKPHTLESSQS